MNKWIFVPVSLPSFAKYCLRTHTNTHTQAIMSHNSTQTNSVFILMCCKIGQLSDKWNEGFLSDRLSACHPVREDVCRDAAQPWLGCLMKIWWTLAQYPPGDCGLSFTLIRPQSAAGPHMETEENWPTIHLIHIIHYLSCPLTPVKERFPAVTFIHKHAFSHTTAAIRCRNPLKPQTFWQSCY